LLGLIGLITGATVGVTGAGGALVALPLFIGLLRVPLQAATVLSLVAVAVAAALNLALEQRRPRAAIAVALGGLGSAASALTLPLKPYLPDAVAAGLIILLVAAGIREVWRRPRTPVLPLAAPRWWTAGAGLLLGVVTAITGLGGGVLLVPLLLRLTGRSYEEVVPTGLLTILLISGTTLALQLDAVGRVLTGADVGVLTAGTAVAGLGVRLTLRRLGPGPRERLRKLTFTAVALVAAANVLSNTL
jgi:uncharacterized membrane protein YfcA